MAPKLFLFTDLWIVSYLALNLEQYRFQPLPVTVPPLGLARSLRPEGHLQPPGRSSVRSSAPAPGSGTSLGALGPWAAVGSAGGRGVSHHQRPCDCLKGPMWAKDIGPQEPQRKDNRTRFKIVFHVAMAQASRAPSGVRGCPPSVSSPFFSSVFHFISCF